MNKEKCCDNCQEETVTIVIPDIFVPFDDEGMQHHEHDIVRYVNIKTGEIKKYKDGIWKDGEFEVTAVSPVLDRNFAFEDSLVFEELHIGNKCAHVTFISTNTKLRYYMNYTEFEKIVHEMIRGVIHGVFSFKKKGKYFSIYMLTH